MVDAPSAPERGVTSPGSTTSSHTTRSLRLRQVLAAVLAVALVASLAWLAMGLKDKFADDPTQDNRDKVMLKARSYMLAISTFGPDDLDERKQLTGYEDRVLPLLTTSYKTDFKKFSAALAQGVATNKSEGTATVDREAVESLSDDSATVIVAGSQSRAEGRKQVSADFVLRISLKKVDGQWKVDSQDEFEVPGAVTP